MVAPVLGSRFVREDFVVSHIIKIDVITGDSNRWRAGAKIANESADSDINDIITEPPSVGPSARHCAAAKAGLDGAGQSVAAENAEA